MSFNEAIRYYRDEILQISQEEACQRLHLTQPALSQYESGKRQIPIETLKQFQKAYAIPSDYMMRMVFGSEAGKEYSPMILREHAQDTDLARIIDMLYKQKPLFDFLATLTYADEKTQTTFAEFLPHFKKLLK